MLKFVSFDALSVHARLIWLLLTALASRPLGAAGGVTPATNSNAPRSGALPLKGKPTLSPLSMRSLPATSRAKPVGKLPSAPRGADAAVSERSPKSADAAMTASVHEQFCEVTLGSSETPVGEPLRAKLTQFVSRLDLPLLSPP